MSDRHELIADLLMGAALADKHLDGRELDQVKKLLCEAMGRIMLPSSLEQRLEDFDADKLDVVATASQLGLKTADDKRNLLELIVAVHDADEIWDMDEDAYLREVAGALGLPEQAFSDLTVDVISVETIGKALMPPPLPDPPSKKPPPMPK